MFFWASDHLYSLGRVGLCLVGAVGLLCSPGVQWLAAVMWAGGSCAWDAHPSLDSSCSCSACQCGGLGSVRLMVGLGEFKGLFQPKLFYDSINPSRSVMNTYKSFLCC